MRFLFKDLLLSIFLTTCCILDSFIDQVVYINWYSKFYDLIEGIKRPLLSFNLNPRQIGEYLIWISHWYENDSDSLNSILRTRLKLLDEC